MKYGTGDMSAYHDLADQKTFPLLENANDGAVPQDDSLTENKPTSVYEEFGLIIKSCLRSIRQGNIDGRYVTLIVDIFTTINLIKSK